MNKKEINGYFKHNGIYSSTLIYYINKNTEMNSREILWKNISRLKYKRNEIELKINRWRFRYISGGGSSLLAKFFCLPVGI